MVFRSWIRSTEAALVGLFFAFAGWPHQSSCGVRADSFDDAVEEVMAKYKIRGAGVAFMSPVSNKIEKLSTISLRIQCSKVLISNADLIFYPDFSLPTGPERTNRPRIRQSEFQ